MHSPCHCRPIKADAQDANGVTFFSKGKRICCLLCLERGRTDPTFAMTGNDISNAARHVADKHTSNGEVAAFRVARKLDTTDGAGSRGVQRKINFPRAEKPPKEIVTLLQPFSLDQRQRVLAAACLLLSYSVFFTGSIWMRIAFAMIAGVSAKTGGASFNPPDYRTARNFEKEWEARGGVRPSPPPPLLRPHPSALLGMACSSLPKKPALRLRWFQPAPAPARVQSQVKKNFTAEWKRVGILTEAGQPVASVAPLGSISFDASSTKVEGYSAVSLNFHWLDPVTADPRKANLGVNKFLVHAETDEASISQTGINLATWVVDLLKVHGLGASRRAAGLGRLWDGSACVLLMAAPRMT